MLSSGQERRKGFGFPLKKVYETHSTSVSMFLSLLHFLSLIDYATLFATTIHNLLDIARP